ncbi:adenylate kinase [Halobacteriales archaeon QS_1_68_20]|nr:MAG: adenylate kinase [Halobacteriales archaeon QS_1_68_20]
MRVALTGTPGTGKTTAADLLETDLEVVHLNDLIREAGLHEGEDPERGSLVADLDAVRERLADREDVLVESHLAHHLDADRVVVLRCHPADLERRLRERGESDAKATENAESEALDVILSEAVREHGRERVHEVDTTDRDPAAAARDVEAVVVGDAAPGVGTVDFTDYLQP